MTEFDPNAAHVRQSHTDAPVFTDVKHFIIDKDGNEIEVDPSKLVQDTEFSTQPEA